MCVEVVRLFLGRLERRIQVPHHRSEDVGTHGKRNLVPTPDLSTEPAERSYDEQGHGDEMRRHGRSLLRY
jgi:hypothetical protein